MAPSATGEKRKLDAGGDGPVKSKKQPKIIQTVKAKMGEGTFTKQALQDALTKEEWNILTTTFSKNLPDDLKENMQGCRGVELMRSEPIGSYNGR